MSAIKAFAKSGIVFLLGREVRPRRIVRGLASGCKICVSPADHLGYLVGTYEPALQRAIRNHVAANDTVYDIGANLGYITLGLAKRVGPGGRVIALEPVPELFEALQRNMEINEMRQVELLNVAASSEAGEVTMRIAVNVAMSSMVWHRDDPAAVGFTAKTVAIDDLVEAGRFPAPKFVKVDVEGAEGFALRGMVRTIAAARPVIYLECSEAGRGTSWELLRGLGYECQSSGTLEWIDAFEKYDHGDFLWLPKAA
jgi:FkbM family methyltransferase